MFQTDSTEIEFPPHWEDRKPIPDIVRLWLLRILVPMRGGDRFLGKYGLASSHVASSFGWGEWCYMLDPDDVPRSEIRAAMHRTYEELRPQLCAAQLDGVLARNIGRLVELIGLSKVDRQILEFAVISKQDSEFSDVLDYLGELTIERSWKALSFILGVPLEQIRQALKSDSLLVLSGLIDVSYHIEICLRHRLRLLSRTFGELAVANDVSPITLLGQLISPCPPAHLALTDFDYLRDSLSVLRSYLTHCVHESRIGVNVLLYGTPGTGKTQLARLLANDVDCQLFEVAGEDEKRDPITPGGRLKAYFAAQRILNRKRSLVLFDEVDDVLSNSERSDSDSSAARLRKRWVNQILETNDTPSIWIANSAAGIDPAFLRRFDIVLEMPIPAKGQRLLHLSRVCAHILDEQGIRRLSEYEHLAPAIVSRAADVVACVRPALDKISPGTAFEQLIGSTLQAQGHPSLASASADPLPHFYDPVFVTADTDLGSLADGLERSKQARLCLYGPPGTGKTAYGRWLADRLAAPLLVRRSSDIVSKWIGESERNVAAAFRQATDEGAVLLIDEVDGFLHDRRDDSTNHQRRLVNEMLTQMESFGGLFIASTNLMDGIDQAALRRFDLKVKFGYLTGDQGWLLLEQHCKALRIAPPSVPDRAAINGLRNLTPGDFSAVSRQARFRTIETSDRFVAALAAECAMKEGRRSSIGFVTPSRATAEFDEN